MTTLEQLAVTTIYMALGVYSKDIAHYLAKPGFLIGDRISIHLETEPCACIFALDDAALAYDFKGWDVCLLGRHIIRLPTLADALKVANHLDALVAENRIHGAIGINDHGMFCRFDDDTTEAIFLAVDAALAA